jgi:hypothetical protein
MLEPRGGFLRRRLRGQHTASLRPAPASACSKPNSASYS